MNPMELIQQDVDKFIVNVKKSELGKYVATWPDDKVKELCIKLIKEESKEMLDGIEAGDWAEIIDGAADTIFVILYAMSKAGIRLAPFWEEVCWTNLQKEGGPIHPDTGKQLKPEGWKPPRIQNLLRLEKVRSDLLNRVVRPPARVHFLKIWAESFDAVHSGIKSHEWRRQDRAYRQGDFLVLREFGDRKGNCVECRGNGMAAKGLHTSKPCLHCVGTGNGRYTGRELICAVTYMTTEVDMANYYPVQLSPDTQWVVMSITKLYELDLALFGQTLHPWHESPEAKAFEKQA